MIEIKSLLEEQEEIIVRRLEDLAEKYPQKSYLFYGEDNRDFTFKEFNQRTNSLARNLQLLGVQKGDIIPVFLRNPMISTFSMFGIWKSGGIYSPINYNYKGDLLLYQLKDTKAKVVITERKLVSFIYEIIDQTNIETVIIYSPQNVENKKLNGSEVDFWTLTTGNTENLNTDLMYWDIANIIYTSGTTGKPKGVVQSYRWMNQYTFYRRRFFNEEDVIYNDLPLYHVGGAFFNVIAATWAGAKVALWDKFSGKDFWERIRLCEATSILLLDVMIPYLMNANKESTDRYNTVNKVYMQPLPQHHHQVARRFGFDIVMSGFGQTESGQGAVGVIQELTEGEGTPEELYKGRSHEEIIKVCERLGVEVRNGSENLVKGYMGKPSMLIEATILNEQDEECEVGVVGQLAFRSRFPNAIFEEYYNNIDATLKVNRNLWFHTGDACYKNKEGTLFFVDRMGGIIRVKGEFVSSYQVEDYINNHPNVAISAVFPIPAKVGDEDDIVIFIVLKEGKTLTEYDINDWIKAHLPKYMWPKYIRFVSELPRTPSSKIEKFKLRKILEDELESLEGTIL
jgi:carnitine-CoA ligase